MTTKSVYITNASRTPVGSLMGCYSSLSAVDLGVIVVKRLLEQSKLDPSLISEVIMGQVLTGGLGQNPARQTSVLSGLSYGVPAFTINKVCGSGLKSIALAYESIMMGNSEIVIAGGQESMSRAMHASYIRAGIKAGDAKFIDMMMYDGLTDVFSKKAMGITAENIASKFGITREMQDNFSLNSQMKAAKAQSSGRFNDEIVPVKIQNRKEEIIISADEFIKPQTSMDSLGKLRPAFIESGTVTAGNSSGINDGAAAVIVASEDAVRKYRLEPIARIASYARSGVDPELMGIGPIPATRLSAAKAGWSLDKVDLFEINEAFAAQAAYVVKELELDEAKVNVNGGSIAIGHPIGASGTRIAVTLLHEMIKTKAKTGIAGLCIGGGMGISMGFEGN
jgi:acetyl-CoA C-acetyltransferase